MGQYVRRILFISIGMINRSETQTGPERTHLSLVNSSLYGRRAMVLKSYLSLHSWWWRAIKGVKEKGKDKTCFKGKGLDFRFAEDPMLSRVWESSSVKKVSIASKRV